MEPLSGVGPLGAGGGLNRWQQMRWRAICERRFERVIGDRTGFVSIAASIAACNHLMALQSLPLARCQACLAPPRRGYL